MPIKIQKEGDMVFIHILRESMMVSFPLTLAEARNLRDYLTDMILIRPDILEAIIKDGGVETGTGPLPENYELLALADTQRRNAKTDKAVRKAILGTETLFPGFKEVSDP